MQLIIIDINGVVANAKQCNLNTNIKYCINIIGDRTLTKTQPLSFHFQMLKNV